MLAFIFFIFTNGYIFCRLMPQTRFKIVRMDGYTLYFYVGCWGFFTTIASLFLILIIDKADFLSIIFNNTFQIFNIKYLDIYSYSSGFINHSQCRIVLYFILSTIFIYIVAKSASLIFNLFSKRMMRLTENASKSNELEAALYHAQRNLNYVSITLKNSGKVYVGWIYKFDPTRGEIKYIMIIPFLSGYRNEKQQILFTTKYSDMFEKMEKLNSKETREEINEKLFVVIPEREIASISSFDLEIYRLTSKFDLSSYYDKKQVEPQSFTVNTQKGTAINKFIESLTNKFRLKKSKSSGS